MTALPVLLEELGEDTAMHEGSEVHYVPQDDYKATSDLNIEYT